MRSANILEVIMLNIKMDHKFFKIGSHNHFEKIETLISSLDKNPESD